MRTRSRSSDQRKDKQERADKDMASAASIRREATAELNFNSYSGLKMSSSGSGSRRVWAHLVWTIAVAMMLIVVSGSRDDYERGGREEEEEPKPRAWPEQFHSVLVINTTKTGDLQVVDLWYDWPNGRNFNIIQHQLGKLVYDLEWNNGTSFYYTLDESRECSTVHFEVGILRPNWLEGATYMGQQSINGFLCNVWEKADFLSYYEDVPSKRPVHWLFYTGRAAHVITFEVGAVLEDSMWQAPFYCFDEKKQNVITSTTTTTRVDLQLLRLRPSLGFI